MKRVMEASTAVMGPMDFLHRVVGIPHDPSGTFLCICVLLRTFGPFVF